MRKRKVTSGNRVYVSLTARGGVEQFFFPTFARFSPLLSRSFFLRESYCEVDGSKEIGNLKRDLEIIGRKVLKRWNGIIEDFDSGKERRLYS